jgi:hypothetical protein
VRYAVVAVQLDGLPGEGVSVAVAAGSGRGVSQPYLGPRGARSRPGDMMTDWVSPGLRGMRPLILIRPSARPLRAGSG